MHNWLLSGDAAVEGPQEKLPEFNKMNVLLPTPLATEKLRTAVRECGAKLTGEGFLRFEISQIWSLNQVLTWAPL